MKRVYPHYYTDFACIGGRCRHSCCIGWEIPIDDGSLSYYRMLGETAGEIGARLRDSISESEGAHFRLSAEDRCPFLNQDGLCDLILALGEDALCDICAEHPRFHNAYADRLESGLGLCCEAAAEMILGMREPMRLVSVEESDEYDECDGGGVAPDPAIAARLQQRDRVIELLQDRALPLIRREASALRFLSDERSVAFRGYDEQIALLQSLEHLDPTWMRLLAFLVRVSPTLTPEDHLAFREHMQGRETEYEQFLVYWVYRYLADAETAVAMADELAVAIYITDLIRRIGIAVYRETGDFSFADQVETVRLFSSELEYSEENLSALRAFFLGA